MSIAGRQNEYLPDRDAQAVLAMQEFAQPRQHAVILVRPDPLRVVWANRPATLMFEADDADAIFDRVLAGRGRDGLGSSIERVAVDGTSRVERLRLIKGFQSRTVVVALGRSALPNGDPIIVLAAPYLGVVNEDGTGSTVSALRGPVRLEAEEPADTVAADATPEAVTPPLSEIAEEPASPPAPPIGDEPGRDSVAELRERFAGVRTPRLLWQTDAHHRLSRLTGGDPNLAGLDDPTVLGRPFATLVVDPQGDGPLEHRLTTALAAGASWSGLRLRWPIRNTDVTAAVTLGGAPIFGRTGAVEGFRGFGLPDLTDLRPIPLEPHPVPDEPEPEPVTMMESAPDPALPEQDGQDSVALRGGEAANTPAPTISGNASAVEPTPTAGSIADRAFSFSPKVVSLRHYQTFSATASATAPEALADPVGESAPAEQPLDTVDLSNDERSNFDEIGRALLGTDTDRRGRPTESAADPNPLPAVTGALAVLNLFTTAVLVAGPDRVHYANPSFLTLARYPSTEAVQAAGGLSFLLGGLDPSLLTTTSDNRTLSLLTGDGDAVDVEGSLQPSIWGGEPAVLLTARHAGERIDKVQTLEGEIKRRALDLSEFRGMLDRVTEGIITVDRKGRILTLNAAAERVFGYAALDAAGEPLAMLMGTDAQVAVVDSDGSSDEASAGLDVRGRTASGKVLLLRMAWQTLSYGRVCVFVTDQQERAALQQELATARDRLQHALSSKPEFLAKISHEIRTPLNAILGFAEIILDERFGPIGNDRYKAYLKDIHDSGASVLGMVNDLMDLSRMEAGRMDMHPAAIEVNRIIGECVTELQPSAHRERVIVRLSLSSDIGAALVDEPALRQIVGNILSNAIKFNEPGGQVIVSTAMNEGGAVVVRVRDTGVGMTDMEIASAMEPFGLRMAAQAGSSGLGLPLARALTEANGATLSIRSQKNEGTLVEILLPAYPAERMRVPAE